MRLTRPLPLLEAATGRPKRKPQASRRPPARKSDGASRLRGWTGTETARPVRAGGEERRGRAGKGVEGNAGARGGRGDGRSDVEVSLAHAWGTRAGGQQVARRLYCFIASLGTSDLLHPPPTPFRSSVSRLFRPSASLNLILSSPASFTTPWACLTTSARTTVPRTSSRPSGTSSTSTTIRWTGWADGRGGRMQVTAEAEADARYIT